MPGADAVNTGENANEVGAQLRRRPLDCTLSVMRTITVSTILVLLGAPGVLAQETQVDVPTGQAPVVDGTIQPDEWADAIRIPLVGGEAVFLKKSDRYLFIAVKGSSGGIGSLGLATPDSLRILHASTGLITADFVRDGSRWRLVHRFRGPATPSGESFGRGEERSAGDYRLASLEQYGWTANVVDSGLPTDLEYQIRIEGLPRSRTNLAVVFFQVHADVRMAHAPANLADDSLDRELISGGVEGDLQFDTNGWLRLNW